MEGAYPIFEDSLQTRLCRRVHLARYERVEHDYGRDTTEAFDNQPESKKISREISRILQEY